MADENKLVDIKATTFEILLVKLLVTSDVVVFGQTGKRTKVYFNKSRLDRRLVQDVIFLAFAGIYQAEERHSTTIVECISLDKDITIVEISLQIAFGKYGYQTK